MAGWQNTSASTDFILGGWHSYLKRKAYNLSALWYAHTGMVWLLAGFAEGWRP